MEGRPVVIRTLDLGADKMSQLPKPEDERNPADRRIARERLNSAYDWLEANLGDGPWAAGADFTLSHTTGPWSGAFALNLNETDVVRVNTAPGLAGTVAPRTGCPSRPVSCHATVYRPGARLV